MKTCVFIEKAIY